MNPLTQYAGMIKLIGGLAMVLVIWFHGYSKGNDAVEVAVSDIKAKHAEVLQGIAEKTSIAYAAALERDRAIADEVAKAAADYEDQRNAIAKTTRDAVLADLRAGRVQLRYPATRCPVPATGAPAAPAFIGDDQADSGIEVAAAAVGIGAEADAQLAACQSVIRAYTAEEDDGEAKP